MKIEVIHHASIKLIGDKIIYFDPYKLDDEVHDADYIFITHDHYDHYDIKSIENISKETTKIILPKCLEEKRHTLVVEGGKHYVLDELSFDVIKSYNLDKPYHPKESGYVGYNILINGLYYYIMGDTDRTPDTDRVKTNICFVPIGGVYTMDKYEAASYINYLKPDIAIPIHYGMITGSYSDAADFKNKVNDNIKVEIKIKER